MFYDILRYMLPYDQQAHPVDVAKTAPYGVVNHWREVAGQDGHGGDTFLSGSITTALRNVYQGMVGFRPGLTEVVVDPVIPSTWDGLEAVTRFQETAYRVIVRNPGHIQCGVLSVKLDDRPIDALRPDERVGRTVAAIPIRRFRKGKSRVIEAVLG